MGQDIPLLLALLLPALLCRPLSVPPHSFRMGLARFALVLLRRGNVIFDSNGGPR